ncbi:MAG: roadblock/LC7 domain-containing protein [Nitrospirae bacterium]|nr:roadblock/LC7 domain-containing protein [Candidatus Troglogloeales bacterium]
MSFREGLERIAEKVDDLLGVAIVDSEGILVQEVKADPSFDLISLVAEYSAFVKAADKASVSMELGPSYEIMVTTDKMAIMIKKINDGYFLLLAAESDQYIGKGRFFMKREAAAFVEDL